MFSLPKNVFANKDLQKQYSYFVSTLFFDNMKKKTEYIITKKN